MHPNQGLLSILHQKYLPSARVVPLHTVCLGCFEPAFAGGSLDLDSALPIEGYRVHQRMTRLP